MRLSDIQMRDPFVIAVASEKCYYLFGTTDTNCWGAGNGFNCYRSADLLRWEGPIAAFRAPPGFWADRNFWAPECHAYRGRYYLFASFKAEHCYRGTQVLVAVRPEGPYVPLSGGPVTPPDWECLDGTLHVDTDGKPWIVFCHEWVQVSNGAVYAMRLSDDLVAAAGRPVLLFNATEAAWVRRPAWPGEGLRDFPTYVTDGPYLHRTASGTLLMLWSSTGSAGYAMGVARSESGTVSGPWVQQREALFGNDGGHGMVFRAFDSRLYVTLHRPNKTPDERPVFLPVEETAQGLQLVHSGAAERSTAT
jgi:arabinan endo-1,5-alpha-L-arabinosidase